MYYNTITITTIMFIVPLIFKQLWRFLRIFWLFGVNPDWLKQTNRTFQFNSNLIFLFKSLVELLLYDTLTILNYHVNCSTDW